MAVSRNNPPSMGTSQNQTNSQAGTSLTTGSSTTTGSSRTTTNANESLSKISDYLDPTARAALNSLIKGLSGVEGGNRFNIWGNRGSGSNATATKANELDRIRLEEISTNQGIRADYSKANAFADAQGAMNATLSQALRQSMPTITAGIDAAGTSGGALSALLTQQMAEDAAGQAAQLGLQAAINYGQIQTGQSNVIESLLGQGSEATNALLEALGIAKGAYENTKSNSSSSQTSNTTSSQTTNSSQATTSTQTGNQSTVTDPSTTKKKANTETGYGLLGSPRVTAMPGSQAVGGTGKSYSQF